METLKKASEQPAKTKGNYDAWKAKYDPIKQKIGETETKLKDLKEQSKIADEQLARGRNIAIEVRCTAKGNQGYN